MDLHYGSVEIQETTMESFEQLGDHLPWEFTRTKTLVIAPKKEVLVMLEDMMHDLPIFDHCMHLFNLAHKRYFKPLSMAYVTLF